MDAAAVSERRFAAQRVGTAHASIEAAVQHCLAIQAQSLRGAELALRVRSSIDSPTQLHDLISSGTLVLSWLNRSTLHLVARDDFWMLHSAVAASGMRRVGQRLRSEGLTDSDIATARDAMLSLLASGDALPKAALDTALRSALPQRDLSPIGVASLIEYAAAAGDLVRGPLDGTDPLYIDSATWLGPPPASRSDNLAQIAARYAQSHADATADDAAYWLGIGKRDMREAWNTPADVTDSTSWTGLLGPFDPLLHGWPDRSWILGEFGNRVVTTNGIFRPTVVVNNECVGIWSHARNDVTLELFTPVAAADQALIDTDIERVRVFLATG